MSGSVLAIIGIVLSSTIVVAIIMPFIGHCFAIVIVLNVIVIVRTSCGIVLIVIIIVLSIYICVLNYEFGRMKGGGNRW